MDDPVIAAERSSRHADDLAAMVEGVLTQLQWQASALAAVAPADVYSRKHRDDARRANGRVALALKAVRDGLGEQHVATDMLADQLHRLFPLAPTTQVIDDADADVASSTSSPVAG